MAHNWDYDTGFDGVSATVFVWNFGHKRHIGKAFDPCVSTCEIPNVFDWYSNKDTSHIWSIFRPRASFCEPSKYNDPERIFHTFCNVMRFQKYEVFEHVAWKEW